jgi:hypothetical protein
MKDENLNTEKTANSVKGVVRGSLHQMRAINTYKDMKEQLAKLKQDVSFREYVGFEIAMKIFYNRYEKWLRNNR